MATFSMREISGTTRIPLPKFLHISMKEIVLLALFILNGGGCIDGIPLEISPLK